MCLILAWGVYSAHVFIFISSTMIVLVIIAEFIISIITLSSKFQMRLILQEQLPKLGKQSLLFQIIFSVVFYYSNHLSKW